MDDCICDDESQRHDIKCVICHEDKNVLMSKHEREEKCKIHHKRRITMCGKCEYVCAGCDALGWYSTAGRGGSAQHLNRFNI